MKVDDDVPLAAAEPIEESITEGGDVKALVGATEVVGPSKGERIWVDIFCSRWLLLFGRVNKRDDVTGRIVHSVHTKKRVHRRSVHVTCVG